jgi:hypothetical protein
MVSFKDYAMRSSALVTSLRAPRAPVPTFEETAAKLVTENNQPVIHANVFEAHEALRKNRDRKTNETSKRVTGVRGEPFAAHIAYAWKPIVRRHKGKNLIGAVALHVLHATKGWKIVHGIYAPRATFVQTPEAPFQVVGA